MAVRGALFLLSVLFAVSSCSTSPKSVPCSNAADCEKESAVFRYCVQSRCVECLDDISCGEGSACVSGMCSKRCTADADCPGGRHCKLGACQED